MKREMTSSERFRAALSGAEMDRIPIYELCFWPQTVRRWHGEGLPADVSPQEYFALDKAGFFTYDGSLGFASETVASDERSVTTRDGDGVYYRSIAGEYSAPSFVRATIHTPDDWLAYRGRLSADVSRLPADMASDPVTGLSTRCATFGEYYALCRAEGRFTVLSPFDPLWYALRVMGEEQSLCAIAAEPEFMRLIVEDYGRFNEGMLKLLTESGYRFDAVWVFSDLCYKNGMLFSPRFFREYVMPSFRRYIALCHEAGSKFIFHSDGDVSELLPLLVEAGVDCVQPLEARAGNDLRGLVPKYGDRISFMGNINTDVLAATREEIMEEIESKLPCAVSSRRYIFHSDHSIPPGVSLENYAYAVETARRMGRYS
jgi:uroporphyrinogen decarboxylase